MEVKVLEIRDDKTFMPVICIRPVADNEAQRYLLRRDVYVASESESYIVVIRPKCHGVEYDPYQWNDRTMQTAHNFIQENWTQLADGSVVDVEYILGETTEVKQSKRHFREP